MSVIGLFDSGVGGTTIWREVVQKLPFESTLLLTDSKNAPYGTKTKDEIIHLCEKNTEFLLQNDSKIIIVACNTATTNAITHLRQKYAMPFIGIEPAIKPASLHSKSKKVGVLATQGTLTSQLFHQNSKKFGEEQGITIVEQIGTGLVELIEDGKLQSTEMEALLKKYLLPMVAQNIDYLVLGCTHYPYLLPMIRQIVPSYIKIIDSGEAVARQTHHILNENELLVSEEKTPKHCWLTNRNVEILSQFVPENISVEVKKANF